MMKPASTLRITVPVPIPLIRTSVGVDYNFPLIALVQNRKATPAVGFSGTSWPDSCRPEGHHQWEGHPEPRDFGGSKGGVGKMPEETR